MFAAVTIANMDPALLAPSGYPGVRDIVSSVALTFFAFLGFGVVTFTAKDLADPSRQLPRAMAIAIGLATVIYVAVSIGVFGTLTVPEVIAAGPTAIAVAAEPVLGNVGYCADEHHGALRDGRRHERRPVPGGRALRAPGVDGSVPARDGSQDSPTERRSACSSPPSRSW